MKALLLRKLECSEIIRRQVIISNITRARFSTWRPILFWRRSACIWGRLALPKRCAGRGAGQRARCCRTGGNLGLAWRAPISRGGSRSRIWRRVLCVGADSGVANEAHNRERAISNFFAFRRVVFEHFTHFFLRFCMGWDMGFWHMRAWLASRTLRNPCASDWIHPSGPAKLGVVQCGLRHEWL